MLTQPDELWELQTLGRARMLSPEEFSLAEKAHYEGYNDILKIFSSFFRMIFRKKTAKTC
jgi:hypothetical protein